MAKQVANRPGEPIELGDHQGIAFAHIVERLLKLVALRDRRHLFAENLVAPGGVKLPLLGFQACNLGERRCPCIAYEHGVSVSHMEL